MAVGIVPRAETILPKRPPTPAKIEVIVVIEVLAIVKTTERIAMRAVNTVVPKSKATPNTAVAPETKAVRILLTTAKTVVRMAETAARRRLRVELTRPVMPVNVAINEVTTLEAICATAPTMLATAATKFEIIAAGFDSGDAAVD